MQGRSERHVQPEEWSLHAMLSKVERVKPVQLLVPYRVTRRNQRQAKQTGHPKEEIRSSESGNLAAEAESIDVAIADALKAQKNRQTGTQAVT